MTSSISDCSTALAVWTPATIRLLSMLIILTVGIISGHLATGKFRVPERFAKKIMTTVLVCFNWPIALLVIWKMNLTPQVIWLPITGALILFAATALSTVLFNYIKLDPITRLTLILAAALSNLGYTGGAFVCYALFGSAGLALANIYPVFWLIVVYLIFFPLLKIQKLRMSEQNHTFSPRHLLDFRFLVLPAIIVAIALNITGVRFPQFVLRLHIIDVFVYIASSLSFFAIGMRVNFSRLKNYINLYFPLCIVKFLITPALAILIIYLVKLTGQNPSGSIQNVIIVLSAAPSAVLMVTMSNVFDLDGPLASALWVVTTAVFVVVVVPVLFFVYT